MALLEHTGYNKLALPGRPLFTRQPFGVIQVRSGSGMKLQPYQPV